MIDYKRDNGYERLPFNKEDFEKVNFPKAERFDEDIAKELIFKILPLLDGKTVNQVELAFERTIDLLKHHNPIKYPA